MNVDDPEDLDADQSDPGESDEPLSGGADDADVASNGSSGSSSSGADRSGSEETDADSGGGTSGAPALTSPLVRKLLREADLSADDVRGSGPGGRITREDAERAIAAGGEGDSDSSSAAPTTDAGEKGPRAAAPTPAAATRPPTSVAGGRPGTAGGLAACRSTSVASVWSPRT